MQTELMLPQGHPRLAIRSESLRFFGYLFLAVDGEK